MLLALVLATLGGPAAAQTFEEAVWANVGIGVLLCDRQMPSQQAYLQNFRASGFLERVENLGGGDMKHTFAAPADTAEVVVTYGQLPGECVVRSAHMTVQRASQLLDQLVPNLRPDYVRQVKQGPVDPATGQPVQCVRYVKNVSGIEHVIAVSGDGFRAGCVATGGSQIVIASFV